MTKIYETDLYEPVAAYFTELGYEVKAEVNDCDLVALKKDELIIVELKLNLNVTLLIQAAERLKLTDHVYIAIVEPKGSRRRKKWRDQLHLIRRLELGFILVSFRGKRKQIEVIHEPKAFNKKQSQARNKRKRIKLIEEFRARESNLNIGGSYQTKLITAYKEQAIHIALCLKENGEQSAKTLQENGTSKKTYAILYDNHYGWFKRVARGIYDLTEKGLQELESYPEVIKLYSCEKR